MRAILVTGGAGYIGSHTVKHLVEHGYNCIVLDNLVYGHREAVPAHVPFEQVDLLDPAGLKILFTKYQFDAVVHFAAFAYVGESVKDPQKYYFNNVSGALNLLAAMLASGVRNIVFSSTCATYGEPEYTPIDEEHPQNPINPYGATKLMVERVFADYQYAYGLHWIALRYFNAAGAAEDGTIGESHNPETHLIPLVFRAIREGYPIKIFGTDYDTPDRTCLRDYIHVDDLAVGHRLALEKLDNYSGTLNLGTGIGTSVRQIIAAAEKASGKKCPALYAPRREGDPAKLFAANEKARNILGWTPKRTLDDIITSAWGWEQNRKF
jgi:UDP-glucose 4-epimerase